ncbi:MAG: tRNA pseudouridine(38-40) synthase TruA [Gammaproteobacteria bacterium]|nr:tRNA pseudouridine(38-40) synthase TruA [Gammaproteobacteria bacterium]
MENLRRLALGLEYDGTRYHGWQYQPHASSIQESLNDAISAVANESVSCIGSGRTDTGVHASGQVVHFDSAAVRSPREWLMGINTQLPDDINLNWIKEVGQSFHARYSAERRAYRYVILNRPVRSALFRDRVWWLYNALDIEAMRAAAAPLIGTHDFTSFRAAGCQSKTPVRNLMRLDIERDGDFIYIHCEANAFLHHMVRNLVGSLVAVGRGDKPAEWMQSVLEERDRKLAGITAPAAGLTLTGIQYPKEFEIECV